MRAPPYFFAPIHREGHVFLAIGAALALFFLLVWQPLGWLLVLVTLWIAYFFRDPVRIPPQSGDAVLSPADGVICAIEPAPPPEELEMAQTPWTRVSIFMSVTDCHINRMPVAGTIAKIAYRPGKFFNASMDKASESNERQSFQIDAGRGEKFILVQIAGLLARRIVRWVEEDARLAAGERIGMIRFGSRVDLYLPPSAELLALPGQTAVAGETLLARRKRAARSPARRAKTNHEAETPISKSQDKDQRLVLSAESEKRS